MAEHDKNKDFAVEPRRHEQAHIEVQHGQDSWQYQAFKFLRSRRVQYTLMILLLADVIILFVELFLQATFPHCYFIERDGISCCANGEATRLLASDHADICEPPLLETDNHAGCDDHTWHVVHTLKSVLFSFTLAILTTFLVKSIAVMIILTPRVYFRNAGHVLDLFIVSLSLALEITLRAVDQETLSTLAGLLVVARCWRFVRRHKYEETELLAYTTKTEKETGDSSPRNDGIINMAIVARRDFLLSEIPLLNDLSQTLHEVIADMPTMEITTKTKFSIGDFELKSIDKKRTGLRFGDSGPSSRDKKNKFQIIAKFCDVHIVSHKTSMGIRVCVEIPFLEIAIDFVLHQNNEIHFALAEKNGITVPSVQASAKLRPIRTVGKLVGHILPKIGAGIDLTDTLLHDVVDKLNPWFEKKLIKALSEAVHDQSSNIVPDGMDQVSFDAEDGSKITCSILFKQLLLDDNDLWLKAHCHWTAQKKGNPALYVPPAIINSHRKLNRTEQFKTDVSAFLDTSLVDQFIDVLWYVTPSASDLKKEELRLGTALVAMLQHLPQHWRVRNEKLIVHLRQTCKPPRMKASDEHGLFAEVKIATSVTVDDGVTADNTETGGSGGEKTFMTVIKCEVSGISKLVGPTYNPDTGSFNFDLEGFKIIDVVVTDHRDSHMSKWLTKFLDRALVHTDDEEKTFSNWWEREGGLIDKCEHALDAFHERLMDRIRKMVDEEVRLGLEEANEMIDREISQFVLPTGEFNLLGHKIQLKVQEINADTDDAIIKIMSDIELEDDKKAGTSY